MVHECCVFKTVVVPPMTTSENPYMVATQFHSDSLFDTFDRHYLSKFESKRKNMDKLQTRHDNHVKNKPQWNLMLADKKRFSHDCNRAFLYTDASGPYYRCHSFFRGVMNTGLAKLRSTTHIMWCLLEKNDLTKTTGYYWVPPKSNNVLWDIKNNY